MSNTKELSKSVSYAEHYAEFANASVMPMNESMANIIFLSTTAIPLVRELPGADNDTQVQVKITIDTQIKQTCSVMMPVTQLVGLRDAIDKLIAKK